MNRGSLIFNNRQINKLLIETLITVLPITPLGDTGLGIILLIFFFPGCIYGNRVLSGVNLGRAAQY